ncbi:phage late control D family protein [Aeromonas veronii]|uniref:phage late control D family protein n=1 Tax=Aeromonas veronii TaxID=654 RepID=UPI000206978C|nr:phage late control D family protein [Aeromonas veronii]AEB50520.1 D protein [Aeromonas veronii B565]MBS4690936.1 phage late control D family protein [Aeromonas veronii bv. veronii]OKP38913.1 late control protein D [Aeromonas veronii bv. veronii]
MGAFDQFGTRLAENLGITSQLDALRQQHPAPAYQVLVDGSDISGTLRPRLMHMTITDNRGFSADTIEIALDDSDGKLAMPRRGATLQASIGWQGGPLVDKGTFKIDEVEHGGAPDVLTIRGKSADLRGGMNKLRERSWHFETIGAIVEQLAARYGLTPTVDEAFKGMVIDHIDQTNESDLAFLTRLATEQDAIATVKSGRLMFIKAGNGTTVSGKPLPAISITRQDGDQHQFSVADRDAYTGVIAYWQDNKAAEKKKIEVKSKRKTKPKEERPLPPGVVVNKKENELLVGDSENVKELRHVYANQSNAMRAARAEWEKLQRGVAEFQITLAKGRPELYPEQPTTVRGFKPQIDEADWLLTQVVHDLTDQGYTNRLQLEVKLAELPE